MGRARALGYKSYLKKRCGPHAVVQREPLEGWGSLMGHLDPACARGTLLVLLSARPGGLSWHSAMDTLPRGLARVFPESSFITLYPGSGGGPGGGTRHAAGPTQ